MSESCKVLKDVIFYLLRIYIFILALWVSLLLSFSLVAASRESYVVVGRDFANRWDLWAQ